jgi:hypothetical protein
MQRKKQAEFEKIKMLDIEDKVFILPFQRID